MNDTFQHNREPIALYGQQYQECLTQLQDACAIAEDYYQKKTSETVTEIKELETRLQNLRREMKAISKEERRQWAAIEEELGKAKGELDFDFSERVEAAYQEPAARSRRSLSGPGRPISCSGYPL